MAEDEDPWRTLFRWTADNTASALVALTGLAFVAGSGIVWAYAAGLGVAMADLGLDVQQRVVVAAGALLAPMLAVGLWRLPLARFGDHSVLVLNASRSAASGILLWWVGITWWLCLAVSALGFVQVAAKEEWRKRRGLPSEESTRKRFSRIEPALLLAVTISTILLMFGAYVSGRYIRNDSQRADYYGVPRVVSLVLPATRGIIVRGEDSACVDRIGDRVMLGDGSAVVLSSWDAFVLNDCERDNVSDRFD